MELRECIMTEVRKVVQCTCWWNAHVDLTGEGTTKVAQDKIRNGYTAMQR
jgi:hypothetical protein